MKLGTALLVIEFTLLCVALPGYIIATRSAAYMFFFLWLATLYCFFIYRYTHFESWHKLWGWGAVTWQNLKPILLRFAAVCVFLVAFTYFYDPERFFFLAKEKPEIIPRIFLLYPLLSALPQEFIFCTFFFARYAVFFKGWGLILASALTFAYAHVLFINPIAPTFSFAAGVIFALTYMKHKSLALVTIEHGLYGNALFLTGLGWYFHGGDVETLA
ncbi:MAG: CPBP family intramembrane metalloprotease [Alphaproteobacteria bacterium]|nr:CPBP family intramembrane metalloprotease [Alphaproteobacteria bacterium]